MRPYFKGTGKSLYSVVTPYTNKECKDLKDFQTNLGRK